MGAAFTPVKVDIVGFDGFVGVIDAPLFLCTGRQQAAENTQHARLPAPCIPFE
jgi:hypothetical protein